MTADEFDMLGQALSPVEAELLDLYARSKALLARDGLDPCVRRNLVQSTAALSQVVTDLGIAWEPLYDLGV
ncbi:MAG TPA: hypothetical protein VNQ73_15235 [Ilumatobacter sp.]|nr:hypothetical protein [Ilumatobacter sp.]